MRIVFFIGAVSFTLTTLCYLYYHFNLSCGRSWAFGLLFFLLALNATISPILPEAIPWWLSKASAWLQGLWIAFTFHSCLLALVALLLWLISKLFGFHFPASKFASVGLLCVVAIIAFGTWRAFHPVVRTENIISDKLATGTNKKIVLLTDIHLGRQLDHAYAKKLAQRVNALEPDIVLIAGDTIDEKIMYVEKENSLAALGQMRAKEGIYLAYGNHEHLDNAAKWQSMVEAQGFHVLRDADYILADNIKITGLEDFSHNRSTDSLWRLAKDNQHYYNIVLDHQPRKMQAASEAGYNLYVAGHTHTGQMFPNRLVTRKMYALDYGRANFGEMVAITSSGHGYWGPPVRTEAAPEIVVINLLGK